jgi:hypothetical protein
MFFRRHVFNPIELLRVFENRVVRRIFGSKRDEVTGEWRSCTMRSFIICSHPQLSLRGSN